MNFTAIPLAGFLIVAASSAFAQESLVGKYAGTLMLPSQSRGIVPVPISLEITSAADGKLQGKANRSSSAWLGQGCAGEYKLAGTYEGNKLDMRATEPGGPAKDCPMRLRLVAEGRKLKGKMGQFDVDFSR